MRRAYIQYILPAAPGEMRDPKPQCLCNIGVNCRAARRLLTPESAAVMCGPGLAQVCETVGIPPVLHMGSCVDNSRILLAAAQVVKAGGLGKDICDLPVAGSAPEWMSEKAISIGHYFVVSGVYTVFGVTLPVSGAPVFKKYLFEDLEQIYGGMWDLEEDPILHARKMIAHIEGPSGSGKSTLLNLVRSGLGHRKGVRQTIG